MEEWLGLLHEEIEFNYAVCKLFSLAHIEVILLNLGCCFNAIVALRNRKSGHSLETLFNVLPIWTRENFKLWGFDDVVELSNTSEESLQVVTALLNEDQVFVTKVLLGRDCWNRNARPSFCQRLVQQKELVVAAFTTKRTFTVNTTDLVNNFAS